jgi:hypothetical protein
MIDNVQSVRVQHIEREIGLLAGVDLAAITRALSVYLGLADAGPRVRKGAGAA